MIDRASRLCRPLFAGLVAALLAVSPWSGARAQSSDGGAPFQAYLGQLADRARHEGVSERTIARMTRGLLFNPRVIALDRAQPGSAGARPPAFAPYRQQHVDAERISRGQQVRRAAAGVLPAIEARFGVPGPVLIAIWGHETNYGRYTGDFDLARSLATLAYDGRRRELFAAEFVALLKMVDRGVPPDELKGSWAGALGNPQFLPSMYLRLAVDADGDGIADVWRSQADTLASIANYFHDAGWRRGVPWGVAATVPARFAWEALAPRLVAPVCPAVHARHSRWQTVSQWRALGVVPLGPIADDVHATLIQPDGPGTPAWLLTGNYQVILQYNCSNYYALSVGLLADQIGRPMLGSR